MNWDEGPSIEYWRHRCIFDLYLTVQVKQNSNLGATESAAADKSCKLPDTVMEFNSVILMEHKNLRSRQSKVIDLSAIDAVEAKSDACMILTMARSMFENI